MYAETDKAIWSVQIKSAVSWADQSDTFLRRSALPITETELKDMAALAMIGLSRIPRKG
jgi:hypothetical protein